MNDMNARAPIPLAPPMVNIAAPEDGLLKTTDLNAPIPVRVKVWDAAEPNYYFQLMFNGELVGERREITDADKPGEFLTVYLSESLLAHEGIYQLGYLASSPDADSHVPSSTIALRVDRTAPGASLLAPMVFPGATFGDHLVGLLPGYAGMEAGDTIQARCNGVPGPRHTVQPDELSLRPIEMVFDREALQAISADSVSITYTVTDRAGNESIASMAVVISLTL